MRRVFSFVIGGLIGFSLIIGIFIFHPVYINVCETGQYGTEQKCEPNNILYIAFVNAGQAITHPEFWTAIATIAIAAFTLTLKLSTDKLWGETRTAAQAALRQADVMMAVESPIPLIVGLKLVQYTQIPGETTVTDPVPPGPIPPNCRILFCIENKGRTPLRLTELCIEKFAGLALPNKPSYTNIIPWPLVLEKGPIWIRGDDQQIVVTTADVGAATAAYGGAGAFWVFGYFAYRNLLNERVEQKFLARWDLAQGFIGENRPRYS